MKVDASIRNTDTRVIALIVVVLAGLIGVLGFALSDPTVDLAQIHPIQTAHAGHFSTAQPAAGTADRKTTPPVTPEENWAADESSHGLRPDAAH